MELLRWIRLSSCLRGVSGGSLDESIMAVVVAVVVVQSNTNTR